MDGIALPALLERYRRLPELASPGRVAAICLQENKGDHAQKVASALGSTFRTEVHPTAPRLAVVYDSTVVRPRDKSSEVLLLPKLDVVPLWQRAYTSSTPEQKYAVVTTFDMWDEGSMASLILANCHLDSAGTNVHRGNQLSVVRATLGRRLEGMERADTRLLLCGDTNCFSFFRPLASAALTHMLEPFADKLGMRDVGAAEDLDTHFFARAREPKFGQRIAVAVGHVGIDFPCRYDIICTDMEVVGHGQERCWESDHDLVWASVLPRVCTQAGTRSSGRVLPSGS